jgi:hypothetical protein
VFRPSASLCNLPKAMRKASTITDVPPRCITYLFSPHYYGEFCLLQWKILSALSISRVYPNSWFRACSGCVWSGHCSRRPRRAQGGHIF